MNVVASLVPFGDDPSLERFLMRLIDEVPASGWLPWLAVLIATGVGALHALGPGHGKALVGAYLASSEGRPRDAVALGVLVAVMHTGSVLVVGAGLYVTQEVPGGGRLDVALTTVSALAVTGIGGALLWRELRRRRARSRTSVPAVVAGAAAQTDGTDHDHDGRHQHGHRHHHDSHHHELPEGVSPLSPAGVAAIASAGGLLPSPAAFLVLATALAVGRTGYGLALVAAFGVGLALTLTTIGLAVVKGRDAVLRAADRRPRLAVVARALPLLSAVAVTLGGGLLLVGAVASW